MAEDAEKKPYDLEERTARFGEAIIAFARACRARCCDIPLIGQLVRASTSVGANYCEADDAVSKKDFRHRISICKKRRLARSKYWLRMIAAAQDKTKQEARIHWQEAKELHLIFSAIWRKK